MRNVKMKARIIIAASVILLSGFCLWGLFFVKLPENNADVLKVVIGFLWGSFTTMVAFYFGDSEGKDHVARRATDPPKT